MAYKISDECISCGACAAQCPVSAITEGDGKYVIDPETCIELALLPRNKVIISHKTGESRFFCINR